MLRVGAAGQPGHRQQGLPLVSRAGRWHEVVEGAGGLYATQRVVLRPCKCCAAACWQSTGRGLLAGVERILRHLMIC